MKRPLKQLIPEAAAMWRDANCLTAAGRVLFIAIGITVSGSVAPMPAMADDEPSEAIPIGKIEHDGPVDFSREILPLFKRHCIACHNDTEGESDLSLESPTSIRTGGASGSAVDVEDAGESLLLGRATGAVDSIMPPEDNDVGAKPLAPEELGLIRLWIEQGATGEVGSTTPSIAWQALPSGVNPIYAVALSPDGQFAACGRANQVFVYHLPAGRLASRLIDPALAGTVPSQGAAPTGGAAHLDLVQSLAFSDDGERLATGGYRTVKLWARPEGVQLRTFSYSDHGGIISSATSYAAGLTAIGCKDRAVLLVEQAGGTVTTELAAHASPAAAVAFSADGKRLASAELDGTVRLWKLPEAKLTGEIHAPAGLRAIALLDDAQLAAAGDDGSIRIYDAGKSSTASEKASPLRHWPAHEKPITALVALGGESPSLASAGTDGLIRVWDPGKGKKIREMNHSGPVTALAASRDGQRLASTSSDGTLKLWNTADGQLAAERKGAFRAQLALAEAERNLEFAKRMVESGKKSVEETEKRLAAESESVKKATEAIAAAEKSIAEKETALEKAADAKGKADKGAAEALAAKEKAEAESSAATGAAEQAEAQAKRAGAARKATLEAARAADRALRDAAAAKVAANEAVDAAGDKPSPANAEAEQLAAESLAVALAEVQLAAARYRPADRLAAQAAQKLAAARARSKQAEQVLAAATSKSKEAAESAEAATKTLEEAKSAHQVAVGEKESAERTLAAGQSVAKRSETAVAEAKAKLDSLVQSLAEATNNASRRQDSASAAELPLYAVAFSPDGARLAAGGDAGTVHTFRADDGRPLDSYAGGKGPVAAVAFPDAQSVTSVAAAGDGITWKLDPSWRLVRTIGGVDRDDLADRVTSLDFSPDGKLLATGSGEPSRGGELKIWNAATGDLVREIVDAHSDTIFGVAFSRDGSRLASCSADKFVKVFNVADGSFIRSFEGHTHHVLDVAWSADGTMLASCGADNVVKIWNAATGEQKRTITGFKKEVTSITFLADTAQTVSCSGDTTIQLHDTDNGRSLRSFGGSTDFVYSADVTPDGKLLAAGGQDSMLRLWNAADGKLIESYGPADPSENQQARR